MCGQAMPCVKSDATTPPEAPPTSSSSVTIALSTASPPCPPTASGNEMPSRPASANVLCRDRGSSPSRSHCATCGAKLYREELQLQSIVKDLPPIFERYEAKAEHRTCKACGDVMPTRAEAKARAGAG